MLNYIEQEHIEICQLETSNENTIHCLPHHTVKKVKLNETKFRIVFYASSHDPGMPSLNDTLEVVPILLPETVECLLRFRMHEFAITGDEKQAFLQLSLHEKDRDATSFFWCRLLQNKLLQIYSSTTRTTIRTPCNKGIGFKIHERFSMLDKNLCFVASVEHEPQIITLYKKITDLMLLVKIPVHKRATNSLLLQNLLHIQGEEFEVIVKILAIEWNRKLDIFGNAFSTYLCAIQDRLFTRI
ncbi:integrase catalytic domain-containing protein [Trichonephila clavata]|uniref:Integrase catalytic domain-containing protein n=1 Tax=Trichonephila clavata TaxID=2740835 RepID=A0A8X6LBM3_TRICU|nr:integrase catalytic domain-containing protein [Trichonephila clavata]